jgi:beta-glucosidase
MTHLPRYFGPFLLGGVLLSATDFAQGTPDSAPLSSQQVNALLDRLVGQMTLDEKIAMLHGATDPQTYGQAGYLPGVPRLGIPELRLTDGPAGVRTAQAATALPAPVALASTFSPELARHYGGVIATDGRARHQNVILAPMVNIVRVPEGGRDFETLGEDPFLASRIVAAEVAGIQAQGLVATVKHFAENNQETQRQSVSADVDERTLHEIELPGFEAAVGAGVGAVMAAYNKVNGTYASEHAQLETDILRTAWGFTGFVMSDWGGTHSGIPALTAGLDMEMPSGRNFGALAEAVTSGQLQEAAVNQAVRRILVSVERAGLLPASPHPIVGPVDDTAALEVATAGAVLLKNDRHALPLGGDDLESLVVIGPTAKTLLIGGGGSSRVQPTHTESPLAALTRRAGPTAQTRYAVGYDVDGEPIPASALAPDVAPTAHGLRRTTAGLLETRVDPTIDFTGAGAIPAGTSATWTGILTAPSSGDYEIRLQTAGGRGSVQFDASAAVTGAPAGGRGRRGGGAGVGLLATALGLSNPSVSVPFTAGQSRSILVTGTAGAATPLQIRLAWIPPGWRDRKIVEAAEAARAAHTAVVFAYDESQEGRDRASLSLPGVQDALIEAVAAANPRTIVVLNNGAPVLMPWADHVAAILQMWYPGQDGAAATASLLLGEVSPGGKLPITFPRRAEDAPTADPARYPGVNGHGAYSEGILVGYRWYDAKGIAPLFPFGHGLSYTTFAYSNLSVHAGADGGLTVRVTVTNTGTRRGADVPQLYVGPPASAPVPMALRQLAGFQRVELDPGRSAQVTIPVGRRELSYWSTTEHGWVVVTGTRTIEVGASSRDLRLKTTTDIVSK